jgi:beta-lactamase superfamily II metal-dependent hydrolase
MSINTKGNLWIFTLNVGQGDTSVVVTPTGKVVIIDAFNPRKLINLLSSLGLEMGEEIERLIITHPHNDHYSGAISLLNSFTVKAVSLATGKFFKGKPGYWKVLDKIRSKGISPNFVPSGEEFYPDGAPDYRSKEELPLFELVGPTIGKLSQLDRANKLEPNHLSIITCISWHSFRMVIGADAQDMNWGHYDNEEMLIYPCSFFRAAHHGSSMGTSPERLEKFLMPRWIFISSDPNGTFKLPDKGACETFSKLAKKITVALSYWVGSVKVEVNKGGAYNVSCFGERKDQPVPLHSPCPLNRDTNKTDWELLRSCREKKVLLPQV